MVLKALEVHREMVPYLVHQDTQVLKVPEVHRELKGHKVLRVPQGRKDQEDHRVSKVPQEEQEIPVLKVREDLKVQVE